MGEATPPVVGLPRPSNSTTSAVSSIESRYVPLYGVLAVSLCITSYAALSIVYAMAPDVMSASASNRVDTDSAALHDERVLCECTRGTHTVVGHMMSIL